MNALTDSNVIAEDKLFATLDTRSRRIRFPREREVVITDTVGFIRDLPKDLFAAFRATFEEAQDADLLLHVIDVADPALSEHVRTTEEILSKLDLAMVPRLTVFNKRDRLPPGEAERIAAGRGVAVSALDRESLLPLLEQIEQNVWPLGQDHLIEPEPEPEAFDDGALDAELDAAHAGESDFMEDELGVAAS